MKRPSFQFYPADWRKDPALSACSLAARGLWIELMCIAHESEEYGYLSINGKPMSDAQLARMVGEAPKTLSKLLAELENAAVFSRREDGAIFSRRMVKDERIRNVRGEAGKLGGNPNLVKQKDKQNDNQSPTPSSSSSSSVTNSVATTAGNDTPQPAAKQPATRGSRLPKDWVLPKKLGEWAIVERPNWTPDFVRSLAERFRDHWISQPGQRGVRTDWEATWRNWVRKELDPKSTGGSNGKQADRTAFVESFTGGGTVIEGGITHVQ